MRIKSTSINQQLVNSLEKFSKNGGEKISNYVNATGKALIAPLVIMHNPLTHEDKDNRKWAAVKQPVEAVITLAMQLATLGLLYKGINKLIHKNKINFKFIEEATKDVTKIPKKIMEECGNDTQKALAKYKEEFNGVFKDRLGAILSAVTYLPVLAVSNKIYPKIAHKLIDKNENKPTKQNNSI
ncbi:MAG: hypothetical protein E7Z91_04245 [Cyanobacteria bacterium SIG30]|nr:hypothetical protein [Cyanobacteria bacterium SIG30]